MFSFEKIIRHKKKGYILIHTYLIGLLALIIVLYIFSLQVNEFYYNKGFMKELLTKSEYLKYKEMLLTKLNIYVEENIKPKANSDIKYYFNKNDHNKNIAVYINGKIIYNSINNCFELVTPYRSYSWRYDVYEYTVREGKMILAFKETKFK